jgi:hypothetical protein
VTFNPDHRSPRSRLRWDLTCLLAIAATLLLVAVACTSQLAPRRAVYEGALLCPWRPPASLGKGQRVGSTVLEVPGHPHALLACKYNGVGQQQRWGTLISSVRFPAARVAARINELPLADATRVSCPDDEAGLLLLEFSYADGPDFFVRVEMGGCRYVMNGDRVVQAAGVTELLGSVLGHEQQSPAVPHSRPLSCSLPRCQDHVRRIAGVVPG